MVEIKIPDQWGKIPLSEAFKEDDDDKKADPPQQQGKVLQVSANIDPSEYIRIPNTDILIARKEKFQNLNWEDTHYKLAENELYMPNPALFMKYFTEVISAREKKLKIYDGSNKELSKDEVQKLYDYLTEKQSWHGSWLDAKFVKNGSSLELETDHKVIPNKGKKTLQGKIYPLAQYLKEDCYAELKFNVQGLAFEKSKKQDYKQGENIYFWSPVEDRVAWFYAYSDRACLICDRPPTLAYSDLGVFACYGELNKK